MRRSFVALAATIGCFALGATSAPAATTIGNSSSGVADGYWGAGTVVAPVGISVPAGGGVITSITFQAYTLSATPVYFHAMMLRPTGMGTFSVLAGFDVPVVDTGDGAFHAYTAETRIVVQAGDVPAVAVPLTDHTYLGGVSTGHGTSGNLASFPGNGSTISLPTAANAQPLVSAVIEPDQDGDGYGDDSQDACPAVAARQQAPCSGDLTMTLNAAPGALTQGDVTTLVATVSGVGAGVTARLSLPAGLAAVSVSSTSGDCSVDSSAIFTCPLRDIAPATPQKIYAVVRGIAVGPQTSTASVSADSAETQPSDNQAASTVMVAAPASTGSLITSSSGTATTAGTSSTTGTGTSTTTETDKAPVKLCRVPRLKGHSPSEANKLLKKAGCTVGRIVRTKARRSYVVAQTIPARVRVVAGTKVGYTLRAKGRH